MAGTAETVGAKVGQQLDTATQTLMEGFEKVQGGAAQVRKELAATAVRAKDTLSSAETYSGPKNQALNAVSGFFSTVFSKRAALGVSAGALAVNKTVDRTPAGKYLVWFLPARLVVEYGYKLGLAIFHAAQNQYWMKSDFNPNFLPALSAAESQWFAGYRGDLKSAVDLAKAAGYDFVQDEKVKDRVNVVVYNGTDHKRVIGHFKSRSPESIISLSTASEVAEKRVTADKEIDELKNAKTTQTRAFELMDSLKANGYRVHAHPNSADVDIIFMHEVYKTITVPVEVSVATHTSRGILWNSTKMDESMMS